MTKDEFLKLLSDEVKTYKSYLETDRQDWIVKGFVDIDRNVYAITNDTKVVSKIIEILLIPKLESFARANGMEMELPSRQNYYPDLTFKDGEGNLFAVDFKSSYYAGDSVNGLTLGSYWGYFRERDSVRNMDRTYNSYASHTVLGVLYRKCGIGGGEAKVFSIDELPAIHSVIGDFVFFVQPKWKIANDAPGSGNTRNIGGITSIPDLVNGRGPFSSLGEDVAESTLGLEGTMRKYYPGGYLGLSSDPVALWAGYMPASQRTQYGNTIVTELRVIAQSAGQLHIGTAKVADVTAKTAAANTQAYTVNAGANTIGLRLAVAADKRSCSAAAARWACITRLPFPQTTRTATLPGCPQASSASRTASRIPSRCRSAPNFTPRAARRCILVSKRRRAK